MICAYKENPYLEDCIKSIMAQTVRGVVKISTSTPNAHIQGLAEKYQLSLVVNQGVGDNVGNFNFAYSQAETALVTLCHQDDYYCPNYLEQILFLANRSKNPLIFFTEYFEDRDGVRVENSKLLRVKRMMNFPLRFLPLWKSKWVRRRILSMGNSICCPAVTFCKNALPTIPFSRGYINGCDWQTWIDLSSLDGDFVYSPKPLMTHRIWTGSTTTELIGNSTRANEDLEIFQKFWPTPIAKLLAGIYGSAQKSNSLE